MTLKGITITSWIITIVLLVYGFITVNWEVYIAGVAMAMPYSFVCTYLLRKEKSRDKSYYVRRH